MCQSFAEIDTLSARQIIGGLVGTMAYLMILCARTTDHPARLPRSDWRSV